MRYSTPSMPSTNESFAPVLRAAFPDLHFAVEDMIAEGDKVVTVATSFSGTHQGEFMGIAATGKPVKIKTHLDPSVADNRIVEGQDWGIVDMLGMMRQLGVAPGSDRNEA